jgi:general secretion pathway protein E
LETAEMAIQASLTGHLVLSTLHTNDSPSAITRLLDIGLPAYLIRATLLGVLAQRLVRCLCPQCKKPVPVSLEQWDAMVKPWKLSPPERVYQPVGCLDCRMTGYKGRLGLYELFTLSAATRELVQPDLELSQLRQQAIREGLHPLRFAGAQKVVAGLTTIDEVLKVAPPAIDEIKLRLDA